MRGHYWGKKKKQTSNNREIAVGESEQNLEADVGALDPLV